MNPEDPDELMLARLESLASQEDHFHPGEAEAFVRRLEAVHEPVSNRAAAVVVATIAASVAMVSGTPMAATGPLMAVAGFAGIGYGVVVSRRLDRLSTPPPRA